MSACGCAIVCMFHRIYQLDKRWPHSIQLCVPIVYAICSNVIVSVCICICGVTRLIIQHIIEFSNNKKRNINYTIFTFASRAAQEALWCVCVFVCVLKTFVTEYLIRRLSFCPENWTIKNHWHWHWHWSNTTSHNKTIQERMKGNCCINTDEI